MLMRELMKDLTGSMMGRGTWKPHRPGAGGRHIKFATDSDDDSGADDAGVGGGAGGGHGGDCASQARRLRPPTLPVHAMDFDCATVGEKGLPRKRARGQKRKWAATGEKSKPWVAKTKAKGEAKAKTKTKTKAKGKAKVKTKGGKKQKQKQRKVKGKGKGEEEVRGKGSGKRKGK